MDDYLEIKLLLSIGFAYVSALAQNYGVLSMLITFAIILDVLTGLLKAQLLGAISSGISFKGLWKKLSLFVAFVFGLFLDAVESYLLEFGLNALQLDLGFSIPFGHIIGIYIVINECISICENLKMAGVKLPNFISKALANQRSILDNKKNDSN